MCAFPQRISAHIWCLLVYRSPLLQNHSSVKIGKFLLCHWGFLLPIFIWIEDWSVECTLLITFNDLNYLWWLEIRAKGWIFIREVRFKKSHCVWKRISRQPHVQGVLSLANVMMTANSSGLTSFSSCFYLCSFLFFRCHPAKKGSKNSLHTYVFNSGIFSWLTEKFTAWDRNGGTHIQMSYFSR